MRENGEDLKRIILDNASVFEEGLSGPFWKCLSDFLYRMQDMAVEGLLNADSKDYALISRLQAEARIGMKIRQFMLDTIEEAKLVSLEN